MDAILKSIFKYKKNKLLSIYNNITVNPNLYTTLSNVNINNTISVGGSKLIMTDKKVIFEISGSNCTMVFDDKGLTINNGNIYVQ